MISGVIFDLDDTLYPEREYAFSGFGAVARKLVDCGLASNAEKLHQAFCTEFKSGNHKAIFNKVLEEMGLIPDQALISDLVACYREHRPDIGLPADSQQVLERLQGRYKLGLLSDGFLPAQRYKLEALGIEGYFQAIVFTEELGREYWKPAPQGYFRLLEQVDLPAELCCYVGDNAAKDFVAPNQMGMATIQLNRPGKVHRDEPVSDEACPNHVIADIMELEPLLHRL